LFVIGAVRAFALSGPATNSVWSSVVVPVLLLAMVGCLIQSHRSTIALENIEQNLFTLLFLRDALEPGAGSNAFLIEPAVDGANIDDWILGWSSEAVGWRLHFKTNGLVPIVREGRRHG
jgi:hypothetical protein